MTCVDAAEDCTFVQPELPDGRRLEVQASHEGVRVGFANNSPAGGPRTLTVTVRRDDELLGTRTFTPTYTRSEPNGRGCGVTTTAHVDLDLQ